MPLVIVKQDVRILGRGFSPSEIPIQVGNMAAEVLIREGFAVAVEDDVGVLAGKNQSGQKSLFQMVGMLKNKALDAAPENKQQEENP